MQPPAAAASTTETILKNSFKLAAAAIALSAAFASTVHAAGFQLTEQSAGALGRAYAGVGVDGTDLSGVYFNPATMVLHPGTQMQAGFVGIGLNLEYAGDNGTKENGRQASQAIPHGFITHQINESTWVGLAMTVPFGMGTEYNDNWEHADHGISAAILTFDFNPNVAWKARACRCSTRRRISRSAMSWPVKERRPSLRNLKSMPTAGPGASTSA